MSHISATNASGRVLQPDIPPPSFNAENRPPPLTLAAQETVGQEATTPKGFWFFKRNNRGGPTSSKPSAPPMARSLSEPNSPTDPSGAATHSRQKPEEKTNYIALALQLLNESKVRFDGHEKDWARFYDRYHQLFAMGQPIHGKIVKYNTPKPNAQDVAKLLVRDIQAKLEELDAEMEILDSEDGSSTPKFKTDIRRAFAPTPEPIIGPPLKPWFNPTTINPVVLDKVDKHRSINPEGTWHGHSRSRSAAPSRPLPNFSMYDARNNDGSRRTGSEATALNSTHDLHDSARDDRGQLYKEAGERDRRKEKEKEIERDRDRRREGEREKDREKGDIYGRERERGDSDRDKPRDKDGDRELGDGGPPKGERGRKDRHRHHRDTIPRPQYPPRPGSIHRERQMSDPAIYTRSSHRRNPSPESLAPAIYTLAEDVEVREGTSSVASRDPVPIAIPRIPTVVAYPGDEEEQLNIVYGGGGRSGPNGGDRSRNVPVASLTPILASDAGTAPSAVASGSGTGHPHRRRRRSRSLGHELDGRVSRSRPRSRSPKKDRAREKEWDRETEREREKEKQRDRDRNREEREREREKEKDGGRDRAREERDRERERDRDREREKDKDKNKLRDRERGKEWDRDKGKDKSGEKDTEREREKDSHKSESMRPAYQEEREWSDSRRRRNRERERDKDRDRDQERERDKGWAREKDRNKDHEREREQDLDKDRDKDREREYNNHRSEWEQPANAPPPTQPPNVAGAHGPTWLAPSTPPSLHPVFKPGLPPNRLFPPNPNSESRFMEILTSPTPPMPYNLPGAM